MSRAIKFISVITNDLFLPQNAKLLDDFNKIYFSCYHGDPENLYTGFCNNQFELQNITYLIYEDNKIIGFNVTQFLNSPLHPRQIIVRADIGLKTSYKNKINLMGISLFQLLFFKLSHPLCDLYFVDIILNFKLYDVCLDLMNIYPKPWEPIPPKLDKIRLHAAEILKYKLSHNNLSASAGDISLNSGLDWAPKNPKAYDFFKEVSNNGKNGILTVAEFSLPSIIQTICKYQLHKLIH